MAKIIKPLKLDNKGVPPKMDSKGEPPALMEQSHNLSKFDASKTVLINFNASAEFRKDLKIYAAELGMTVTDLIIEAVELHKSTRK